MKYQINVTQEDIEKGKKMDCFQCPVALAIKRAANVKTGVMVARDFFAFENRGIGFERKVSEWITRYDRKIPVSPFTFEIEV